MSLSQSSNVASKKLHLAVHGEDAVMLQVLVVGRDGCLHGGKD